MILAVKRAERYSPNSVEKDAAIMESVAERLRRKGHCIVIANEDRLSEDISVDTYVSMARSNRALATLKKRSDEGVLVVNNPSGVVLCNDRRQLTERLRQGGVNVPEKDGPHGVWLKRASGTTETAMDIHYAADREEREIIERRMHAAGIIDIMACAHVPGDLVKFYGVLGTDFFSAHYPTDDGDWKLGHEKQNGPAQHYDYNIDDLRQMADKAARLAGLTVYGGDCIIDRHGKVTIIDLNDWPSFSRCRDEAAGAIAEKIDRMITKRRKK